MSYPTIDGRTVLIDALKIDIEDFQLSNAILPNKKSIKAIYFLEELTSDLLTFAKNPNEGLLLLPKKPKEPEIKEDMTQEEAENLKQEYFQLMKTYADQEKAFMMHVAYGDYIIIQNYIKRFWKTIIATRAIKGNMFYSFTKNEERPDNGLFSFLSKKNNQQQ